MTAEQISETGDEDLTWLLERRQHFDELVGGVEDYAIFMMSKDGTILDWNCGAEILKGYKPEEIVGKSFSNFYSDEEVAARIPEEELEVAAAHGKFATEGWRVRKGGGKFWASVTITAIKTPAKHVAGFLKITRDLTERQEKTEALRQSEERLRLLIESVADYAIFMLDPSGTVVSWNTGARKIKGYEAEEILGQHFSRFYPDDAVASGIPRGLLQRALKEGSAEDEGWRIKKSGERFWASVLITPVTDEVGEHRGFVKITRDLTERRKSLELIQASERKDTFLAMLAHELRNPLAPMAPGVEMILKSPHDTGRVIQIASMLRRQVGLMSRLIEDLVDLSRITTGKIHLRRDRLALPEVLETAIESTRPLLESKGHRLILRLPPTLVEIDGDLHRLVQAVVNLLTNAAKYTPPNGQVELAAEATGDRLLELVVRDNGSGIPGHRLESIFDLFDQGGLASTDGLGIGLTLVRTIVELHGGSVVARSAGENQGSEFRIRLPIVANSSVAQLAATLTPIIKERCRVLVADDSTTSADTLALWFESEGFDSAVAYDGKQAIEVAKETVPQVVCLDIGMPVMNGIEAASEIRKIAPDAFIIAITGWGTEEDRSKTRLAGFDLHLVKPVRIEDLNAAIMKRFPKCYG
ncbi:PAS domain S-box protein [Luteolibacter sp. GHJ8]|uniref:histidine kinase n=1 Tax=Luteolibacter rhizosphaerae TaxID=2989719 RepID=A0ABT3G0P1_9BACT|nr:PAS domain S-box protein [Luteolibacter rhizosphaerae]MCW1913049.1 PAS domain S-box protein [Luteolibacter rhizosphaerae]